MRLKVVLSFLLLAVSSNLAFAQMQVQPPTRPYNVLSYNLRMDWRNVFEQQSLIFSGHNQIDVVVTGTTSVIVLDASEMSIDSVRVNGQLLTTPGIIGDTVAIPLTPAEQAIGNQVSLSVYYTHTIDTIDPQSGMFFYPKGTPSEFSSGTIPEDLAYTMSEPDGARKWMPCNDEPYYKANSSISVIVPSDYSAQSNGTLLSVDTDFSDGSLTFNWMSDRPIATYLMAAYASKWVQWHDEYHRLSNHNDSIPVNYYAWQADYVAPDTTGGRISARFAFRNTPKMIENDSRLFGEYPFSQYSQVPLDSFYFGGMEHQSITALYWGVLYGTNEDVIAHELFHQWFGDKTTCETWADIWLNEGFATLGEALWEEYAHGYTGYERVIQNYANGYFTAPANGYINNVPTYDPPVDQMFGSCVPLVYWKPGCVLHTLRRVLGDTTFFNTLRDYSSHFAYTTANTFQFRDFLAARDSAVASIDLKDFINEWIFQPDYPIYQFTWSVNQTNLLTVRANQSQNSTDHYTMPLTFWAVQGTDTTNLVFVNNARSQTFSAQLPHAIDTLFFDQEAIPISNYTITHDANLAVAENHGTNEPLRVFTESGALKLTYAPIVSEQAMIGIVDILGRAISEQPVNHGSTLAVLRISELASGDYFVSLTDGQRAETVKFHWEK